MYQPSIQQNDGAFGVRYHSMQDVANHAAWEPRIGFSRVTSWARSLPFFLFLPSTLPPFLPAHPTASGGGFFAALRAANSTQNLPRVDFREPEPLGVVQSRKVFWLSTLTHQHINDAPAPAGAGSLPWRPCPRPARENQTSLTTRARRWKRLL